MSNYVRSFSTFLGGRGGNGNDFKEACKDLISGVQGLNIRGYIDINDTNTNYFVISQCIT